MASQQQTDDDDDNNNLFSNIINRITNISNTYIAPTLGSSASTAVQSELAPIVAHETYIGMPEPDNTRLIRNITSQLYTITHSNLTVDDSTYDDENIPDIDDDDVGSQREATISSNGDASMINNGNYFSPLSFMSASNIPINSFRFDVISRATIVDAIPINIDGVASGNTMGSVIQRSFDNDKENYKQVLADGDNIIKSVPYSAIETDETECSIMKEPFEPDTMVVHLPCKHVFCHEAIKHWLETESATCPVCRYKLPSKEIKNDDEKEETSRPSQPIPTTDLYRSIIMRITEMRAMREEQDIQQAIFNSLS